MRELVYTCATVYRMRKRAFPCPTLFTHTKGGLRKRKLVNACPTVFAHAKPGLHMYDLIYACVTAFMRV